MIDGKVIDHPILNKLKESKQEFILTGSRRYEGASTGDWDFFCLYCPEVVRELRQYGFSSDTGGYHDYACKFCMFYDDKRMSIDIQLIKPDYWKNKICVHEAIILSPTLRFTLKTMKSHGKVLCSNLWDAMITISRWK